MSTLMPLAAAAVLTATAPGLQSRAQELGASASDSYAYDPGGRRDPFIGPVAPSGRGSKPSVDELALRGIVRSASGYRALLVAPGGTSHAASVGTLVGDGEVIAIDDTAVTFRQDAAGGLFAMTRSRVVRIELHPTEATTTRR